MDAEISGLLRGWHARRAGHKAPNARRAFSFQTGIARAAQRETREYIATLPLADIDMLLWIRHLSPTAAPRRQYPDL
ncbi:MAG: hypothetical protein OEO84_11430 [Betaproteobacteria bacterium]|nr:hypothetical protein [Betaproteobacteria bacterium]